jgi:hypothetical protein
MIRIINGRFFYKLEVEKQVKKHVKFKKEVMKFLKKKGMPKEEIHKMRWLSFKNAVGGSIKIKAPDFDLKITVNESTLTLLFGTSMDSNAFAEFIKGYLE